MIGATLPTPMYALYAERMHFERADHDGDLRDLRVRRAVRAAGLRPVVGRRRPAAGAVGGTCVRARQRRGVPGRRFGAAAARGPACLSGLSAGIFTGTATAAVIEAAPPNWHNRAAAVATVANVGGLGGGPLLAGLLVQYAPQPLHLTFIVHIGWFCWPRSRCWSCRRPRERTGTIGLQRLAVPPEVRGVFVDRRHRRVRRLRGHGTVRVGGAGVSVRCHRYRQPCGGRGRRVRQYSIASAVAQLFAGRIAPKRALVLGCAILIVAAW